MPRNVSLLFCVVVGLLLSVVACTNANAQGRSELPVDGMYSADSFLNAPSASITVDRNDDPVVTTSGSGAAACTGAANDCSLRGAIVFANANAGSTITIPAGTFTLSITGSDNTALAGDLDINSNVTINGAGSTSTIITTNYTSTCGDCKVFGINQDGTHAHLVVSISGVTIQNGFNSYSATCNSTFQETGGGIDIFQTGDNNGGYVS